MTKGGIVENSGITEAVIPTAVEGSQYVIIVLPVLDHTSN